MAKVSSYPKVSFSSSQQSVAYDPSRAQVVRVENQEYLDAAVSALKEDNDIILKVDSIADLADLSVVDGQVVATAKFRAGGAIGQGAESYTWGVTARHDGGKYIDPARAVPNWSDETEVLAWYADSGEDATCFVAGFGSEFNIDVYGGGIYDDSLPAQAAVDRLSIIGGGEVKFSCESNRTFISKVNITSDNVKLNFSGCTVDASNLDAVFSGREPLFHVYGEERGSTTMTASPSKYDTEISVASAADIEAGDLLYIESSGELWYTESGDAISKRFLSRVSSIDGLTITLQNSLPFSFDASTYTVTVESCNCVKNFSATGGYLYGGGIRNSSVSNGVGPVAFHVEYGDSIDIGGGGMKIHGFQGLQVRSDYCVDVDVHDMIMRGYDDDKLMDDIVEGSDSGFYGYFANKTLNPNWTNLIGIRTRHLQDAGNSWYGKVANCKGYHNHRPSLGCHSGCSDFEYTGCNSIDSKGGCQWRGHNFKWNGGYIKCPSFASSGIYDSAGSASDIPKEIIISSPNIVAERRAIYIDGNVENLQVHGGSLTSIDSSYHPVHINTLYLGKASVSDAYISTNSSYTVYTTNNSPVRRDYVSMSNCICEGYSSSALRVFGVSGGLETDVIAKDNRLDADNGATVHINAADTRLFVSTPNYANDGTIY